MKSYDKFVKPRGAVLATICAAALELPLFADPVQINPADFECSLRFRFSGYRGLSTLENFPVLIKLSQALNDFDYSKCKAQDGGDLRFADSDGNLLDSEVDTWNPGGTSLVWVRIPSLSKNTSISAYYGSDNPPQVDGTNVWWKSGYVGVWHMNGSTLPIKDSSGVSSNIYAKSANVVLGYADGAIGDAVDMSAGAWGHRLDVGDHDNLDGFLDFTLEMWTKQSALAGNKVLMSKRGSGDLSYYWYTNGDKGGAAGALVSTNGSTTIYVNQNTGTPSLNVWTHQAYVRDTAANHFQSFVDGVAKWTSSDSKGKEPIWAGSAPLQIGGWYVGGSGQSSFNGQIDEVRISRVARSSDWIQATSDCVLDDCFAVAEMDNDWGKYTYRFAVTFPGCEGETIADIPVLLRISEETIDGFRYCDSLRPNGMDLRFALKDGTPLDSEVDTWDTNGVSLVWVKIPSLNSSTMIYCYYGWNFAPVADSARVWSNGYVGVWHMGEDKLPLAESSGVSTPIDSGNAAVAYGYTGAIGGAVDMSGVTAGWANQLSAADDDDLDGFTDFTLEMWTKQDAYGETDNPVLLAKRSDDECAFYWCCRKTGADDGTRAANILVSTNANNTTSDLYGNLASPPLGEWNYQAVVRDTSADRLRAFLNGTNCYTRSSSCGTNPIQSNGQRLSFGSNRKGYPFPGQIDEVRISRVARSAAWIKATHDMVKNANFATYGDAKRQVRGLMIILK